MKENHQYRVVSSFNELITSPFGGQVNAICWKRELVGNFSEIVEKVKLDENMAELGEKELLRLQLSEQGKLAREILLQDLKLLKKLGALPVLNVIEFYERDEALSFFSTDVYSFHVDRSPVPTDTYLCTYVGAPSEIVVNSAVEQKVLIPEIRAKLKKLHGGSEEDFEDFLLEYFFDLHYQIKPEAKPTNLGLGNLWRLAIDHPESEVLPCVHRAPLENTGERRLLLIC